MTHPLISCSTHHPSSWQYLQSLSRQWQIPATSTASLLKSAACICHYHLQWIPYMVTRASCYIVSDNTLHLVTRPCLPLDFPVTFSPKAIPNVEPLICFNMPFSTSVTIWHCVYFYFTVWSDYSMLDSQTEWFYCFFPFNFFCI